MEQKIGHLRHSKARLYLIFRPFCSGVPMAMVCNLSNLVEAQGIDILTLIN